LFKGLSENLIDVLLKGSAFKNYSRDEYIVSPGRNYDVVFLLVKGKAYVTQISREGKEVILEIVRPGGVFSGDTFAFIDKNSVVLDDYVQSVTNSLVLEIPKELIEKEGKNNPQLIINILNIVSCKLYEADSKIKVLALFDIKSRLKHELIHIARKEGFNKGDHFVLREKMTHEELAKLIGSSRETVTKSLGELKEEGLIKTDSLGRMLVFHK
jgi:CRP/FNR family transcriptional regulator, cyclic AMP receptor protein